MPPASGVTCSQDAPSVVVAVFEYRRPGTAVESETVWVGATDPASAAKFRTSGEVWKAGGRASTERTRLLNQSAMITLPAISTVTSVGPLMEAAVAGPPSPE